MTENHELIGDAILALIDSGIDEGAEGWSSEWRTLVEFDPQLTELESCLNDENFDKILLEYVKPRLVERLRLIIEGYRKVGT